MLNLGHTFGHVIELQMGYGSWLHGEAISVGIIMAFDLSLRKGWVDKVLVDRVLNLLTKAKLPIELPSNSISPSEFIHSMKLDKKTEGGVIKLVLPRGDLGNCVLTSSIDTSLLLDTINNFI